MPNSSSQNIEIKKKKGSYNYECFCLKLYTTYAGLYLHLKVKHSKLFLKYKALKIKKLLIKQVTETGLIVCKLKQIIDSQVSSQGFGSKFQKYVQITQNNRQKAIFQQNKVEQTKKQDNNIQQDFPQPNQYNLFYSCPYTLPMNNHYLPSELSNYSHYQPISFQNYYLPTYSQTPSYFYPQGIQPLQNMDANFQFSPSKAHQVGNHLPVLAKEVDSPPNIKEEKRLEEKSATGQNSGEIQIAP